MKSRSFASARFCLAAVTALMGSGLLLTPAASAANTAPTMSGILAGTWQHADGSNAGKTSRYGEANAQLDLLAGLPMGPGSWQMEVKAGTTPRRNGVSTYFPEATGLSGETLDSSGNGRLAVTQLYYRATPNFATISTGLLFVPGFVDTNNIADDEYRQFQGTTFVNNPTIALPTYVLGGALQGRLSKTFGYTAFVSSTADLHRNDYGNLFNFGRKGHGIFSDAELNWQKAGLSGNVGLWQNNDNSYTSFSSGSPEDDYGLYTNVDGTLVTKALHWNVRLGWANPHVSKANYFVGGELAYDSRLPFSGFARPVTYGIGVSHTGVSPDATGPKANRQQVEAYARTNLIQDVNLTFDVQYLRHSQFLPGNESTWVEGVRTSVQF